MANLNPFDQNSRVRAQYRAAIEGVGELFSWLPLAAIEEPPHQQFDAYLARQIAVHITCEFFGVPRKRLVAVTDRARQRIGEAIEAIEQRRDEPVFEEAYRAMCGLSQARFDAVMQEALTDG